MEMTFENISQLQALSARPGYSVDFVDGDPGFYDPDGNLVDENSLVIDRASKEVVDYKKVTKKRGTKEVAVKKKVTDLERQDVINECLKHGMRIDMRTSTKALKDMLDEKTRKYPEQYGSLGTGDGS